MATTYEIHVEITVIEKDRYQQVIRSPVLTWDSSPVSGASLTDLGQLLERVEKAISE